MRPGAFIGDDLPDPSTPIPRLTNYDLAYPGSPLGEMLAAIVRKVNERIAPAVIDERFMLNNHLRALEFRGRWGTFRVKFTVSEMLLDRGMYSDRLAYELEGLMADAIQNAVRDLVRAEMRAEVVRVESAQDREWKKIEREYAALLDRVAHLETPWYQRLWNWWLRA